MPDGSNPAGMTDVNGQYMRVLTEISQTSNAPGWAAWLISFFTWWNGGNRMLILDYTPAKIS